MKTHVLFQVLLSVCLFLSVANSSYGQTRYKTFCNGQTKYKLVDLDVKKTDYDVQGTLRISQSYDKKNKILTLKMKNEYKHDVFLYQSITSHLFVCDYADQEQFPANRIPISISGDVIIRKKIIKPDSTHVIPYNCEGMIARGFDQVSFEGTVPYFLVDEKEEIIAIGSFRLEENRFDL